jgi:hypothetical protein
MDRPKFVILIAVVVVTALIAPVIANEQRSKSPARSCGMLKTFDKKSKTCMWKY